MLRFGADAGRVHLHAENSPAAGPVVEQNPGGPVVEVQLRQNEVDIRHTDPTGMTLNLHHLAAAHPAQRVDGVYAVVHHMVPRPQKRRRRPLVEPAHRVTDRPALQTFLMQLDHHRAGAPLKAHLGDAPLLLGHVRHRPRLVDAQAHRFLDVEIESLVQAPDPDVVHQVRLADGVDRVRRDLVDHLRIATVALLHLILVGRAVQPVGVDIADSGDLHIVERGQRGVVDAVGHAAGTDHRHPDFLGSLFLFGIFRPDCDLLLRGDFPLFPFGLGLGHPFSLLG